MWGHTNRGILTKRCKLNMGLHAGLTLTNTTSFKYSTVRIFMHVFLKVSILVLVDIDECAIGNYTCGDNSACVNALGSYACFCIDGYTGRSSRDGKEQCSGLYKWGNSTTERH